MTDVKIEIERTMRNMGMSGTRKGFWCFYWSVVFALENPMVLYTVSRDLYPLVAEACNMSKANVERDMRSLVEWCWDYGDREAIRAISGRKLVVRPSVGELVDYVAAYLRYQGY